MSAATVTGESAQRGHLSIGKKLQQKRDWEIVPGTIFPKMFLRGVVGKLEMEQLCICMATYAQMLFLESCFVDVIGAGAIFLCWEIVPAQLRNDFPNWNNFSIF